MMRRPDNNMLDGFVLGSIFGATVMMLIFGTLVLVLT